MKSICSPPTAFCLLPTACCLYLGQAGWRRLLAGMAALDKMSPLRGKEETSNFKK